MAGSARRSGLALFSYAVLAAVTLWFAASLVGHITALKAPSDPRLRFTSEIEARQYFAQHPNEILAFNRALDDYKSWVAQHPEALNPANGLGTHSVLFSTLADVWGLIGASILALLVFGIGRRRPRTALIVGGFALSFILGRVLLGWVVGFVGMGISVLPEPWSFLAAFVAPPLLLWLGGLLAIVLLSAVIGGAFAVLVGVPVAIFNQIMQFEIAAHIFRYKRSGLIGRLVRLSYWLAGETVPDEPDDSKGARFAVPDEVEKLRNPRGMAFGHVNGVPLLLHTEKHILIQASTRSGKGVALLIPHLLRYQGSVFCLDPKGENAKASGRYRQTVNDKTHYLDPFGISGKPRSRFNPLSRFTIHNMEAASKALARAFVLPTGGRDEDHWQGSAQQLLALCILYVYTAPGIPSDKKDMGTVRNIILSGVREMLNACATGDDDETDEATESSAAKDESQDYKNLLSDLAASFLQTPPNEFGSILSHAQRNTEILDNPDIRACLAASGEGPEVDFADWRKGTMSVFLCLSAPKFPVFNRWLRLVLTAALDEMTDRTDPPPLPVAFVLDEVATLGHLQVLENAVGLAAGYGIQLIYVFQDTAQMRDLYKGRWASFVSNAGIRALFNLDDYDTAEYWSKTIGNRLVEDISQTQSVYGITQGQSVKESMRALMPPEEIMLTYAKDVMLILPQGSHPVTTDRVPYHEDDELKGRWDDPRVPVPDERRGTYS